MKGRETPICGCDQPAFDGDPPRRAAGCRWARSSIMAVSALRIEAQDVHTVLMELFVWSSSLRANAMSNGGDDSGRACSRLVTFLRPSRVSCSEPVFEIPQVKRAVRTQPRRRCFSSLATARCRIPGDRARSVMSPPSMRPSFESCTSCRSRIA